MIVRYTAPVSGHCWSCEQVPRKIIGRNHSGCGNSSPVALLKTLDAALNDQIVHLQRHPAALGRTSSASIRYAAGWLIAKERC